MCRQDNYDIDKRSRGKERNHQMEDQKMKCNIILFVDDESNVLSGLRRMLKDMRKEWEMSFAESGEKALAMIEEKQIDVVVSDMRMPGMDGATLLKKIQGTYPHIVRIILSGYAEEEAVLRTVGPAHQYLAKPCEASIVIDTINRALNLRKYLDNEHLQKLVSGIEHLPSPPETYMRLLSKLESPQTSGNEIADIISEDIAMTALTLKLTNSAYFALPQRIENLRSAVSLLGLDTIKSLALIVGFFQQFSGNQKIASLLQTLSERSMSISVAANAIAKKQNLQQHEIDKASSAGALTHIGSLVLMANWPDKYEESIMLVEQQQMEIVEAERKVFGAAHPEIGAYLLGLWGFNDQITEAIAFHHAPQLSQSDKVPSVLISVYAAQTLLKTVKPSEEDKIDISELGLDTDYLQKFGIYDQVHDWVNIVRKLKTPKQEGV